MHLTPITAAMITSKKPSHTPTTTTRVVKGYLDISTIHRTSFGAILLLCPVFTLDGFMDNTRYHMIAACYQLCFQLLVLVEPSLDRLQSFPVIHHP